MKVTIGVVARNEAAHIADTLSGLLALEVARDDYEIIVVDGDSSDGTKERAEATLRTGTVNYQVLSEREHGGRGLCFARNLVIDRSSPESRYIAFVDADCRADPGWLRALLAALEAAPEDVAGAGGGRAIAPTDDPKELVINSFITSHVGSGFNPVFSSHPAEWVRSIANYNAIYRKELIARFRYDEALGVSDDNEINYRIARAGYRFRFVPEAIILHRETNSVRQFARNMFAYGANIANSMRKHRTLMRPFVPLSIGLLGYLVTLPVLWCLMGPLAVGPLLAYVALGLAALGEVALATHSPAALWVLALFPIQHLCYALGVITHLYDRRVVERGA